MFCSTVIFASLPCEIMNFRREILVFSKVKNVFCLMIVDEGCNSVSLKMFKCVFVTFLVSSIRISNTISTKPNIVVILADDLGWNEVSWNNPKIQTPNLKV